MYVYFCANFLMFGKVSGGRIFQKFIKSTSLGAEASVSNFAFKKPREIDRDNMSHSIFLHLYMFLFIYYKNLLQAWPKNHELRHFCITLFHRVTQHRTLRLGSLYHNCQ